MIAILCLRLPVSVAGLRTLAGSEVEVFMEVEKLPRSLLSTLARLIWWSSVADKAPAPYVVRNVGEHS